MQRSTEFVQHGSTESSHARNTEILQYSCMSNAVELANRHISTMLQILESLAIGLLYF
jgi:hypothetical protein